MKNEVKLLIVIGAVVIGVAILGMNYYRSSVQNVRVTGNTNSGAPALNPEVLIRPDSPTLGPANAPVAIVEFVDPECESCATFSPVLKKMVTQYDGKTKLVIRYMPLHPNSVSAANMLEAAAEQGKFWETQALLFEKQPEWGERHGPPTGEPPPNIPVLFEKYAKQLGLDVEKVNAAIKENKYQAKIDRDKRDGQSLGVRQTPTIFVNGRKLLNFSEAGLKSLVESEIGK
ncbi:MAG: DsbA family protein [Acidobacteria bacterium]|nr:DsbA family protein [Acidobacteriota bacterium]